MQVRQYFCAFTLKYRITGKQTALLHFGREVNLLDISLSIRQVQYAFHLH